MSVKAILYGLSYTKAEMDELLDDVQDSLLFDDIPNANSDNPVKSGGIYSALGKKQNTLEFDDLPEDGSQRMLTSGSIYAALSAKLNTLTIASSVLQGNTNPVSSGAVYTAILGLTPGGSSIIVDDELSSTSENPVLNKVIYDALDGKANSSDLTNYATTSDLSGKAPKNHASSTNTYGVGTDSNYGHLKITDNATNTAASSGIAISPKAVYNLTQTVNGKQAALSSDNPLPVSSGGTGATTFTSGALLIGNGTSAVSTRSITNNTSATAIGTGTSIPTMNTIYNGLPTINNAHNYTSSTTIYAPTAGGTADTQALVGNGATTAPKWVNISPSIAVTAGDASNAPKINVSVLGRSGTALSITTASTSVYGVTKLTDSYTSTNKTLAATGASILAAIQGLDVSSVGGSGKYISAISETDGKISATATSTSVSNTWTNGTTNGPTIKTTVNGVAGAEVAIPSATATTSGIVTTSTLRFGGAKGFNGLDLYGIDASNNNSRYIVIRARNAAGTLVGSFYYDTGDASNITSGRWSFLQLSPYSTASTSTTEFREFYRLPYVSKDLTEDISYSILTSKNVVTAAQGGTGETSLKDAANAFINALTVSNSASVAGDYIIALYANGGTDHPTYYRKSVSALRVGGLTTARKLKVALGSTTDVTFDGTADLTAIPVSGTLPVARGGTGVTSLTALKTALDWPAFNAIEFSDKQEITLTVTGSVYPVYYIVSISPLSLTTGYPMTFLITKLSSTTGAISYFGTPSGWEGLSIVLNVSKKITITFPASGVNGWIISNKAFTIT